MVGPVVGSCAGTSAWASSSDSIGAVSGTEVSGAGAAGSGAGAPVTASEAGADSAAGAEPGASPQAPRLSTKLSASGMVSHFFIVLLLSLPQNMAGGFFLHCITGKGDVNGISEEIELFELAICAMTRRLFPAQPCKKSLRPCIGVSGSVFHAGLLFPPCSYCFSR